MSTALHCKCPTTATYSPASLLSRFFRISLCAFLSDRILHFSLDFSSKPLNIHLTGMLSCERLISKEAVPSNREVASFIFFTILISAGKKVADKPLKWYDDTWQHCAQFLVMLIKSDTYSLRWVWHWQKVFQVWRSKQTRPVCCSPWPSAFGPRHWRRSRTFRCFAVPPRS